MDEGQTKINKLSELIGPDLEGLTHVVRRTGLIMQGKEIHLVS